MKKSISIDNPCNMNWDEMTPNGNGKYCNACKLTVVDFTQMTDNEIHQYLLGRSYVCGSFYQNQVAGNDSLMTKIKEKTIYYSLSAFKYCLLILFALPILISSCYNRTSKVKVKTLKVKKESYPRRTIGLVRARFK